MNEDRKIKVLYVHGYMGHANGESSRLLGKCLEDTGISAQVDAPPIPVADPQLSADYLTAVAPDYDAIVASSMGAFYTAAVDGPLKVLINPADPEDLRGIGAQLTEEAYEKLDEIRGRIKSQACRKSAGTFLIFGGRDTVAVNNGWFRDICHGENIHDVPGMEHKANEEGMQMAAGIIREALYGKKEA